MKLVHPYHRVSDAGLSVLSPDSILYGRPVFFLVWRKLQRGLDDADPRIRQSARVGCRQVVRFPNRRRPRMGRWRRSDKQCSHAGSHHR
jgi:hypothetical protein